ncbi:hypothetical protein ACP_0357 [Acidobacterium capsulatum ATCC 51196]|uniref:Uncharacterized protein n=1 Tax=Acidobacterium capsulatum (strain ATCC 51196 / DSM 11244 / BCRC 80197 / JCM 7670 / NBRC 15755 / NCIMB 13165 / 161) TaxID=240015 RepID=C1F9Y1_ACIC5|nr:hypothetical protein ACP_0357 [Acidobacterium capsulatum ATCC 51196]
MLRAARRRAGNPSGRLQKLFSDARPVPGFEQSLARQMCFHAGDRIPIALFQTNVLAVNQRRAGALARPLHHLKRHPVQGHHIMRIYRNADHTLDRGLAAPVKGILPGQLARRGQ